MNKQNMTLPVFRFAAKLGKVALLSFVLVLLYFTRGRTGRQYLWRCGSLFPV